MRQSLVAWSACAVAVALGACSGGESEPSGEPALGDVIEHPSAADLVLPLDAFMPSPEERGIQSYSEDLLISECLAEQGVQWDAFAPGPGEDAPNARRYGLIDAAEAAMNGYVAPVDPHTGAVLAAGAEEEPVPNEIFLPCLAEAREAIGTTRLVQEDSQFLDELSGEAWNASESDSRVQEAFAAWSDCMADAGYESADHPLEFSDAIAERRPGPPPDPAGESPGDVVADAEERAAAQADVACKDQVDLAGTWLTVETAYQAELLEEHAERLEEIRGRRDAAIERAAEIVESGVGSTTYVGG